MTALLARAVLWSSSVTSAFRRYSDRWIERGLSKFLRADILGFELDLPLFVRFKRTERWITLALRAGLFPTILVVALFLIGLCDSLLAKLTGVPVAQVRLASWYGNTRGLLVSSILGFAIVFTVIVQVRCRVFATRRVMFQLVRAIELLCDSPRIKISIRPFGIDVFLPTHLAIARGQMQVVAWDLAASIAQLAGYKRKHGVQEEWSRLSRVLIWAMDDCFSFERRRLALASAQLAMAGMLRVGSIQKPLHIEIGGRFDRPRSWLTLIGG